MVDTSCISDMTKRGIVINESLLEHGRHLSKPPSQIFLRMSDWEESNEDEMDTLSDEDEMDALLLKAAELPAESSDEDIDKILLQASCQFEPVSPLTAKKAKIHPKESDRFGAVATSSQIQEMHQGAVLVKTKQATSWSLCVWEEWCIWQKSQPAANEERKKFVQHQDITLQ